MTDVSLARALRGLILFACFPALVYCNAGCTNAIDNGRHTLAAVAVATNVADLANAARIRAVCGGRPAIDMTDAAAVATRAGEIAECVEARGFVDVIAAIDAVDEAMLHAQERLDRLEARGIDKDEAKRRVREVLACVRTEADALLVILRDAGVPIPDEVRLAVSALALVTGTCSLDEVTP